MVQYGKFLKEHRVKGWEKFYVDYNALKRQIRRYEDALGDAGQGSEQSQEVLKAFSEALDVQIERCVLFFLEQQGLQAARLQQLQEEHKSMPALELAATSTSLMDQYRDVGRVLLQLIKFLEMNAEAVRKILKKFDRRLGLRLKQDYIASRTNHQYSHLKQIFKQVGLGALVGTIVHNLDFLHKKESGLGTPRPSFEAARPSLLDIEAYTGAEGGSALSPQGLEGMDGTDGVARATTDASGTEEVSSRQSFSLFRRPEIAVYMAQEEPIIKEIEAALAHLTEKVSYSTYLGNALLLPRPPGVVPAEFEPEFDWWSLQLNQFNTFLYMVNYYIIVPTSDDYAVQLHAPASLCGVIIGATPFCALASSLVFSKWSNRSYSEPLYASTLMLVVGNLCYALALDMRSVPLLLLGRALEGLGGARAINRRYISDHVPTKQRTSASAAFVSAGALGMAAGPFLAGLLTRLNFKVFGLTVNAVTSPGWLMVLIWIGYVGALALCFKEPSRKHLELAAVKAAEEEASSKRQSGAPGSELEQPLINKSGSNGNFNDSASQSEAAEEEDEERNPSEAVETLSDLAKELSSPILVLLFIYFMLKFATEILVSESSLVTKYYFDWSVTEVGNFLGLLGLTVLPIATVVGNYISNLYEDRLVVMWTQVIIAVGAFLNLHIFGPHYSQAQYMWSALLIFVACNVLEGVNLTLLSRIMSPRLSRGTFNCGLLSTEAGTFARVVGDGLITAVGYLGTDRVLNLTVIPVLISTLLSVLLTRHFYYALY